jgi:hypothetical protein
MVMPNRLRILAGYRVSRVAAGVTIVLLAVSTPTLALDYTDATPSGPEFPTWDGGDTGLRFADIDADGHVDFLSIGDHGSPYINTNQHGIMVYFGDGQGDWSIHMEGDFGYGGIAVGDVNNDGLLDVGYGMHHDYSSTDFGDQLIEVALGDGTGTSWSPWDDGLATNGETYGMFATDFADVDADGDLDLASNSFGSGNGVHVYRNEGDGIWTQTWARTGGNAGAQLCFGDVNGDGFPDIAATYQHGTVFLGDGQGGFAPANNGLPPAGLIGHSGVSLGDVDGDGCADISFTEDGGVRVYAWRSDHWVSSSSGLPAMGDYDISLLRDMDVDGLLDVMALGGGVFSVWLGDGTGNWTPGGSFTSGPASGPAALEAGGDIDHNGLPDVVFVQREGVWPNDRNELHVIRETTIPGKRAVAMQFPRGQETFHGGSVQTLRWSSAHVGELPATIDLEFSPNGPGGPWLWIAEGLADSGHHQWIVPATATDRAHVRVTLSQGAEGASTISAAFRILDPGATATPLTLPDRGLAQLHLLGNPFRGQARFRVDGVTGRAGWHLTVYDAAGRTVRRLRLGPSPVTWDLADHSGQPVGAGVYFVALARNGGGAVARQRVVVLR